MIIRRYRLSRAIMLAAACTLAANLSAQDDFGDEIIIDGDADELIIEDDEPEIVIEDDSEELIIEEEPSDLEIVIEEDDDDELVIEDDTDELIIEADDTEITIDDGDEELLIEAGDDSHNAVASSVMDSPYDRVSPFTVRADKVMLEYGHLVDDGDSIDAIGYAGAEVSVNWSGDGPWEWQLAGRVDAFSQYGDPEYSDPTFDYGDSYLRYRGDSFRVTAGAQTVIWGRIDEIPPSDRLSVQDLTRFIMDDLQDRRRARPMVRVEHFSGANKIEALWMPTFREAELPDKDSMWYPIDRRRGEILGIESNPLLQAVVQNAAIDDDAPDSDNAVGLRFTRTEDSFDYGLTAQHGRQSAPYFEYQPGQNVFKARYTSATSLGGDIGFEAGGATWRFEAAWISDLPATRELGFTYTEVEAVNWAAGVEFYPGDGDSRLNLQIVGMNLYDAPDLVDRDEIYNFNGSLEVPFAEDRWRAEVRFFAGLDKRDVYVNPELTFLGWQPHYFYVEAHYFDGDSGTIGGFHEDHSMLSVGWRAEF